MIEPALSAEEWANETATEGRTPLDMRMGWAGDEAGSSIILSRHALAALALHGQDFGFTHKDVRVMITTAESLRDGFPRIKKADMAKFLFDVAARIAALLPPEGT